MAEHIFLPDRFRETKSYVPPRRRFKWAPPDRSPGSHGSQLRARLQRAWEEADKLGDACRAQSLPHPEGAHITFRLVDKSQQQLKKLEKLGRRIQVRLRHVYAFEEDGQRGIVAVVWVPKGHRGFYAKKLHDYLTKTTKKGIPRNNDLVACIEDIRSTLLEDFWPNHEQSRIPQEPDWVEVWLATNDGANQSSEELSLTFEAACQRLEIAIAPGRDLAFPERRVRLVKASRTQLQCLIETCSDVAELRLARECVSFFSREAAIGDWVADLADRTIPPTQDSPAVCVFDTGVNRGHQLIGIVCQESDCLTVVDGWGSHDHHPRGHGTGMCGLAAYGPLEVPLGSSMPLELTHWIESVKLQGPVGHLESLKKDLWGQFTERAAALIEAVQPTRARIFCMAITATEDMDRGIPSSWSGAVDQMASGYLDDIKRLILISAGNVEGDAEWLAYPESNETAGVQDPAQAWNALTVGAYTDKVLYRDSDGSRNGSLPIAERGDLSPYSTTTLLNWDKAWPIKPEIVCEGGNILKRADGNVDNHDDLDSLTTSHLPHIRSVVPFWGTSAATAHAAWMAGQIQAAYPQAWPETVRALLVHSARWTDAMLANRRPSLSKDGYRQLVQTVGYGVPDLGRALECGRNTLTMVSEQTIQPYELKPDGSGDRTKEMHIYDLPWPVDALRDLPPEATVRVRITLSYFVEPSPQEIGWKDRYRYLSFGLRWDMMRPTEDEASFLRRISAAIAQDEEAEDEGGDTGLHAGSDTRWCIGSNTRSRGSLHADIWEHATAADVASCNRIAVYPTIGWWRKRKHLGRVERNARYTLVVSVESQDESIDIYTPVANQVGIMIAPTTIAT